MVGLAGAVGAVVVATSLSPIAPLGEARLAEDSTGIAFDTLVLPLGALATVAVVLALGIWPAWRAASHPADGRARRTVPAPRRWWRTWSALGAPPTAVIGVRNALERRSGGAAVPLGSALLGMVLAVIALCATGGLRHQPHPSDGDAHGCGATRSRSASIRRAPPCSRA